MEAVQLKPQEQIQELSAEKSDVPVPCVREEILEAVERTPQEHVQNCTEGQLVDVPDSQIHEEIAQQNKTFLVIKIDLVKKFLEKFAEIAEVSADVKESFDSLANAWSESMKTPPSEPRLLNC